MDKCSLELCVAIDFTKANGDRFTPGTPHYCGGGGASTDQTTATLNDYQWIMSVVGETLRDSSATNEYPIWGFGGSYEGNELPIFRCGQSQTVTGVKGLLSAYSAVFDTEIVFGRQRNMDTVIKAAAQHAKKQLVRLRACVSTI